MPELARRRGEAAQVLDRAELGVDRVVAALLRTDRPWRARVARPRGERVVAPLAVLAPDRVDRRQVDHVEAELGQPRQLALDSGEASPRAREQLVPGAEARALAVDLDRERLRAGPWRRGARRRARRRRTAPARGRRRAWRSPASSGPRACAARARSARGRRRPSPRRARPRAARRPRTARRRGRAGRRGSCARARRATSRRRSVQASTVYSQRPVRSTSKRALPAHAVEVASTGDSGGLAPALRARPAVARHRAQPLVAVAEDVGAHGHRVAHAALGRDSARRRRPAPGTGSRSAGAVRWSGLVGH